MRSDFDDIRFEHCALPELDLDEIDLSASFLGRTQPLPFLISSMTGGPTRGMAINRHLAEAAEMLGIPFAVGSQRVALEEDQSAGIDRALREYAPTTPLFANFGAAQLRMGYGLKEARRVVEMIDADALILHLNPVQEAIQPKGDRNWRGILKRIETLAAQLTKPIVVKEVGFGISGVIAQKLIDAGVSAIDVAGSQGTSWAIIEAQRCEDISDQLVGRAFANWGIPTPTAIRQVRQAGLTVPLIASGGIRDGVDAARALRLGADLVGQAGPVLTAALQSTEAVLRHFDVMARQLRIVCFATGSANLSDLKRAPLLSA